MAYEMLNKTPPIRNHFVKIKNLKFDKIIWSKNQVSQKLIENMFIENMRL